MPEYWNMSLYSDTVGFIDIITSTDTIMKGIFSLFLILVLGIWIVWVRKDKGDSTNDALLLGSFYSFMLALVLYMSSVFLSSNLVRPGLYLYIPMIIIVITSVIKWYNKR